MIDRKQIKAARALLDLSQPQLAEVVDISFSSLKRLESTKDNNPNMKTVTNLINTLNKMGIEFVDNDEKIGVFLKKKK